MTTQSEKAPVNIIVPDIGDSENVEIIEILVSAGDQVMLDDSLVTLESDKASMEIPASEAGVVQTITVKVGDTVNSGDVIGTMTPLSPSASDAADPADAAQVGGTPDSAGEQDLPSPTPDSQSTTAPTTSGITSGTANVASNADASAQSETVTATNTTAPRPVASPTAHIEQEKIRTAHASPGVRRYAREHGADLSLIKGTGRKDRILKTDVQAFIKSAMEGIGSNYGANSGAGMSGIPAIPEVDFTRFGEVERVELGRINKLSAKNLHRAWLNIPLVTHHDEADITDVEAFRQELKKSHKEGEPKITGLAFHMKALVHTLKDFPKVNSSLTPDGEALFYKKYFHIGIAVDTPNGLVVPVFRDVDKKSISELAAEMADVSHRARNKKLKPDEMQGASMTISSLGGIGGTAFTPLVNPPEVAILGITRARMQPVWDGEQFIPRLMCPLDLSYDHRVVDGADAARFLKSYCAAIKDVRRLLL